MHVNNISNVINKINQDLLMKISNKDLVYKARKKAYS